MKQAILLLTVAVLLIGCAGKGSRGYKIGSAGIIKAEIDDAIIVARNQQSDGAYTNIAASTPGLAGSGVPPVELSVDGHGFILSNQIDIKEVDELHFKVKHLLMVGENQGVKIPESIQALVPVVQALYSEKDEDPSKE